MKLALILFDQEQRWRCTSPASLSIPSCSSADGQVTLSFIKLESKSNNFQSTSRSRCSCIDRSEWSQTSHLAWSPTTTPGNVTIKTMPRRDAILDATSLDGCSYWLSPFSTDRLMAQKQLMEEASSHRLQKALGEGRVEILSIPNPTIPCSSCASPSNSRIGKAFGFEVASLIGHRQSRERVRTGRQKF